MITPEAMKKRTKAFGVAVVKLVAELPNTLVPRKLGDQLLRSGTSVGANYRAACRARSRADFISKMGIVEEEADEAIYWMELLTEVGILPTNKVVSLMEEANQILSITVSSIKTARKG
jgi:four helix bundle protein